MGWKTLSFLCLCCLQGKAGPTENHLISEQITLKGDSHTVPRNKEATKQLEEVTFPEICPNLLDLQEGNID